MIKYFLVSHTIKLPFQPTFEKVKEHLVRPYVLSFFQAERDLFFQSSTSWKEILYLEVSHALI